MANVVGFLPLGWKLESIDDYEAVYRFEGDTEFLGVHRQLTFPLKVSRVLDEIGVFLPKAGTMLRCGSWMNSERKARRLISDKMYCFTRRFYGLKPKRKCLFKVELPKGDSDDKEV